MSALSWAVVICCLASCSSAPGSSPHAGKTPSPATTGSSAQSTLRPEGSVDANPSDPPLVLTGSHAQAVQESLQRLQPPPRSLPVGRDSAAWFARVQAAVGPNVVKSSAAVGASSPGDSEVGWDWSSSGVKKLSVGAEVDANKNLIAITCFAQDFDPADQEAVQKIASVFALCASAAFPGARRAAASRWVDREEALMLADLRAKPHAVEVLSTTPSFGPAVYELQLGPMPGFGVTFLLKVM
jgi:hypothetical protein